MVSKYLLLLIMENKTRSNKRNTSSASEADCNLTIGTRMAGEERRLQILLEAVKLFSKRGFRGTTTKEIAQATGVSEAMVFRHFATKDELYAAILDYKACIGGVQHPEEILKEITALKDDRVVFKTLALKALDFHKNDPDFQRLLLYAALEGHELARMFWERMVLHIYEVLGNYIRQRQIEGAFRDINPKVVVRAFTGMMIQHSLTNNLWDKSQRLLKISNEDAADAFADILLKGIVIKDEPNAENGAGIRRSARKNKLPEKKSRK